MTDNIVQLPSPEGFEAVIDDETMYRMEKGASSQGRGQERRCALVAIARNRATLTFLARTEPAAFSELAAAIKAFKVFAIAQLDVAEAAVARIEFVEKSVNFPEKMTSKAQIRKASVKNFTRAKVKKDNAP